MPPTLHCPSCQAATPEFKAGHACPDCGARLVLHWAGGMAYVLVECHTCGNVYDGVEGRPEADSECVCPKCGTASRQFNEIERESE